MRRTTLLRRFGAAAVLVLMPAVGACASSTPGPHETPVPDDAALHRAIVAARPSLMQRLRIRQIVHDTQISPGARPDFIQAVLTDDQRQRFFAALKQHR